MGIIRIVISSSVGQTGEIVIDSQWKLDPQKKTGIKQVCLRSLHVWFSLTDSSHLWTTNIKARWFDANCKEQLPHLHFKEKIRNKKAHTHTHTPDDMITFIVQWLLYTQILYT